MTPALRHVTILAHMRDDDLDATFFALSSELRRRMLDLLLKEGGCNVNRVCEFFADESLIHERWTTEFSAYWAARLTRLKYRAEGAEVHAFSKPASSPPRKVRRHG